MDGLFTVKLFPVILAAYSGLAIALYLAVRLQLKYSYYPPIRQRKARIRDCVIASWEARYKNLGGVLDNVLVEHLRVLGKHDELEDKRFTRTTLAFYVLSGTMFLGSTALSAAREEFLTRNATLLAICLSLLCLAQVFSLALVVFANYYEFNYYKTLEDLERSCSSSEFKPVASA